MPAAEETTSQPIKGKPSIFKNPWILPSSAPLPWTIGKATSTRFFNFLNFLAEGCSTKKILSFSLCALLWKKFGGKMTGKNAKSGQKDYKNSAVWGQ